jgi:DNA polymerase III subunit beta
MNRQTLLSIVSDLSPAVSNITGGHILLQSDGFTLTASAVSERFSLTLTEPTKLPAFSVCPNHASLKSALSGMNGEKVTLTPSDDTLILNSRGRRTVRCLPASTFPAIETEDAAAIQVDGDALSDAIAFVVRAATDDQSKPMLQGVHLNGGDVVASDGSRLRIIRLPHDLPAVTIPTAAATALTRLLKGAVTVRIGRRATFEGDGFTFSTSLVSVPFPPQYPKLVPDEAGRKLVVTAEDMQRAVNAVAAFADSKTKRVFLTMDDDTVTLSCDAAEEPLNVGSWDGGAHKVLFNGAFMADTLAAFGKQDVTITFKDEAVAPLRFSDSAGKVGVLMPMRF